MEKDCSGFHPVVSKITNLLETNHVWFETFQHEPVLTSEQAANIRTGYTLHQGAKALIVRYRTGQGHAFAMIVVSGDCRFNSKKAKQVLETDNLTFATEQEVADITDGVLVGGVPPFGNLFGLSVFVDQRVLENEKIIFNAGDRRFSIAMQSRDYQELARPTITDIVEE